MRSLSRPSWPVSHCLIFCGGVISEAQRRRRVAGFWHAKEDIDSGRRRRLGRSGSVLGLLQRKQAGNLAQPVSAVLGEGRGRHRGQPASLVLYPDASRLPDCGCYLECRGGARKRAESCRRRCGRGGIISISRGNDDTVLRWCQTSSCATSLAVIARQPRWANGPSRRERETESAACNCNTTDADCTSIASVTIASRKTSPLITRVPGYAKR